MDVFITDIASCLPNDPVPNDRMEEVLGMVGQVPSRTRRIILRRNGIRSRYYAIDPETGRQTHTNAQLTAEAVRALRPYRGFTLGDIECLSCGTATPDQLMPGHASMVHGELGGGPCEAASTAGICTSGASSLKYAFMSVALGLSRRAVATGSEIASSYIRSAFFKPPSRERLASVENQPMLSFEADFLRWMLSDGAGAAFLTSEPEPGRPALKIEWIEYVSFAHELETCMFTGAVKDDDGTIRGWRTFPSLAEAQEEEAFAIKQDVKLLNREVIRTAADRTLPLIRDRHGLTPGEVDWFLPHYSSEYFRQELSDRMEGVGFGIDQSRWFTNLATKGNTGSASIYIILEELFRSGRIGKGERLLCFIPESGRFSISYVLLRMV